MHLFKLFFLLALVQGHLVPAQTAPRKCILVFGAHADDADEIGGGTLARYMAMGYQGVYVDAINNLAGCNMERPPYFDKGPDFTVSPSPHAYPVGGLETIQIREEEAKKAAAVYGATPVFLRYRETWLWQGRKPCYVGSDEYHRYAPPGRTIISVASVEDTPDKEKDIEPVVALLREYQPEIVIIHTLGGEKHDHGNSAFLMYIAFKKAMAEGVPVGKLWMTVNGWLADSLARSNGRGTPDVHIDVRDYLRIKYAALDQHVSQHGGLGRDYVLENHRHSTEVTEDFITVLDNTR
jgi:LmbE family N-acetylglucosaminyl deacetylase